MVPNHQPAQSTLRDYAKVISRRKRVVLIAILATVIPAVLLSLLQDPVYTGESEMLITATPGDSLFGAGEGSSDPQRAAENAIRVLEGRLVEEQVKNSLGLTESPPPVTGVADGETDVIDVSVEAGDADSAAELANAYVQAFINTQRSAATATIQSAAEELRLQIDDLGERIAEVDATIAGNQSTRTGAIDELRASIRDLESQRTLAEIRLSEIEVNLPNISLADTIERRDLSAQSAQLTSEIDRLQDEIDDLDAQDDAILERSRQSLFDQESDFISRLDELQIDSALASGGAVVLTPAEPPDSPTSPRPILAAFLALLAGVVLGVLAAFLLSYLDDSIVAPTDLAKLPRAPVLLAAVPDEAPIDHQPIAITKPDTFAVEAFRTLRTNIQFLGIERQMQVVQVTSAVPSEGKSTTAANLAVVLAQTGRSVILVDADLRKPTVHRAFRIDRSYGLTTNLAGESIEMTVQHVSDNFDVLVAGPIPPNPSELLSSQRMGVLIGELRDRYDYIVVDAAPVLAVSDSLALVQFVDGVVVVVQAGRTTVPRVRNALEMLEQVSAPVVGMVLNRVDPRKADLDEYQYGSAYGRVYGAETTGQIQRPTGVRTP